MLRPRALSAALLLSLTGLALPALAADQCDSSRLGRTPPAVNFRVDNDLFGGEDQDQGYSNGALLTLVSPNLVDYTDDPCLPRTARWVNSYLERLHPGEFDQQNMVFSIGQAIFTPTDYTRRDVIPDDRPYAGILSPASATTRVTTRTCVPRSCRSAWLARGRSRRKRRTPSTTRWATRNSRAGTTSCTTSR